MTLQYVKPTQISLRSHPEFNETWVRDRIVEDTSILGLGELEVKAVECIQPKAGRLDLLLRDPDSGTRYEVELMLGTLDESHIIRTIEYWDIEKKRYSQYDHIAVIVAENITSRFLNVIRLFNNSIPLIAIKMVAIQLGQNVMLQFIKVLDIVAPGDDDEDDDGAGQPADREFWENKGSKGSVAVSDDCLKILQESIGNLGLKYNKYYIGITESGRPNNFVIFRAKKAFLVVEVRISEQDSWKMKLEESGLVLLSSGKAGTRIKFRLTKAEAEQNHDLLKELFEATYKEQQE
jgi:hypothetical protein